MDNFAHNNCHTLIPNSHLSADGHVLILIKCLQTFLFKLIYAAINLNAEHGASASLGHLNHFST
jgi:hypothetical protein